MKPYTKLSSKEKTMHNIKGAINYNLFTITQPVQNLLSNNYDPDLHAAINSCLERCIKDMDDIFIKHSKPPVNENESKDVNRENA